MSLSGRTPIVAEVGPRARDDYIFFAYLWSPGLTVSAT